MNMKSALRHTLRALGQRFPQLRRYSGKLGLGRLVTSGSTREQIRVDGDVVIELDLSVPIFRYLYFHHDLSSALETILIRRLLTPNDTFVDVGAHIGYFTLVAAKYTRHVFAFEPNPSTYAYLQRNIQLNPALASRVTSYPIALSDHVGSASLFNSPEHPDLASLQPIESAHTVVEAVTLDTLDHVLSAYNISFLKIDVEGGELDVLNGARETVGRDRPLVLCELLEPFQQRFGHTCQDIVHFFHEYGYKAYHVQEDTSRRGNVIVKPLDLAELSVDEANNALFVPSERVAETLTRLSS